MPLASAKGILAIFFPNPSVNLSAIVSSPAAGRAYIKAAK